ncbi:hypothetical protein AAVH_14443 [Aphelenchoides avenae]|nr:hypothetical protein AAVH_14443 [Aphelenchus avenae]
MCVLNRTTLTSDSGAFAFIRHLTQLEFLDTVELFEFISTALRKCVLGSLDLRDDVALDAIKKVAHTIVIKDKLVLYADTFVDVPTMVEFVENFRVVESLLIRKMHQLTESLKKKSSWTAWTSAVTDSTRTAASGDRS